MSRLTLPHYGGKGHYMKCSEQFGCNGLCGNCDELDKIVEKLAEYEDKEALKPQTNADRIRAMSDEELAEFVCEIGKDGWIRWGDAADNLKWLKHPAGEE